MYSTFTISPFFVFVIIRGQWTPWAVMIFPGASMITFSKINEWKYTTFAVGSFSCWTSCLRKKTNNLNHKNLNVCRSGSSFLFDGARDKCIKFLPLSQTIALLPMCQCFFQKAGVSLWTNTYEYIIIAAPLSGIGPFLAERPGPLLNCTKYCWIETEVAQKVIFSFCWL